MLRLPRRSPLFPYTTLFRSGSEEIRNCVCLFRDSAFGPALRRRRRTQWQTPTASVRGCGAKNRKCQRRSPPIRSEEHTSELQSLRHLVCRLLLEKKKNKNEYNITTKSIHKHNHESQTTRHIITAARIPGTESLE